MGRNVAATAQGNTFAPEDDNVDILLLAGGAQNNLVPPACRGGTKAHPTLQRVWHDNCTY